MTFRYRICAGLTIILLTFPAVADSQPESLILFSELDIETNINHLRGIALDRGDGVELFPSNVNQPGVNFTDLFRPILTEYEVNDPSNLPMEIEFESSTIGIPLQPGIGTDANSPPVGAASIVVPPQGERGAVVGDLILNSALQNPSITNGMTAFFNTFFHINALSDIDGPDFIVLEIGRAVGQSGASGAPVSQGGDPFEIALDDGTFTTFTNADYITMGAADQSGPMAFFNGGVNVLDDDLVELSELETNPLIFRTATSGMSVYASIIDLNDLDLSNAVVSFMNIRSISDELPDNDGFAPDIVEIFSLSARSLLGTFTPVLSSTGVLDITALIPFDGRTFSLTVIPAVGTDNITEIIATQPDIRLQVERNVSFNPPTSDAPEDQVITFTVNGSTFIPVVPVLTKSGLLILALLFVCFSMFYSNKNRFKMRWYRSDKTAI